MATQGTANPLATEKIAPLIAKFALPAIISALVSALYNIVDQIFIGHKIGFLGNAATNVAFPLVTISLSMALLLGVGSASNFSLALGRKEKEVAGHIAGTGLTLMFFGGIILAGVIWVFLEPLMKAFGAGPDVLDYALTYTGITAFGLPFFILATGGSNLIRADGSPKYAMYSTLVGAGINTVLDPLFLFVFDMGMEGAALATIIGQITSGIIVLAYFRKFKTISLTKEHFIPRLPYFKAISTLGAAACFNQLAMTLVQIIMNNTLTYYGALSIYGRDIPLACVGVITKVNIIFMAFSLGIAQGCQPIVGFNYGAKNYGRVRETYLKAALIVTCISTTAFLCFQIFPRQIISLFGDGNEIYFQFAENYFRIFMAMTFMNGIQPLSGNFFTAIGKAKLGIAISLTRQILFLVPLILILPKFFGIDGVMFAGPVADLAAFSLAVFFISREMKLLGALEKEKNILQ